MSPHPMIKKHLPSLRGVALTFATSLLALATFVIMNHLSGATTAGEVLAKSNPSLLEHRAKPWRVPGRERAVSIWIDNTLRYQLDGQESPVEFAKLVPPGGPTVRLPSDPGERSLENVQAHNQTYTVALFHQLACLDIIREDYVANRTTVLTEHCLNYLRQTILCLSDTKLEPVRAAKPPNVVILAGDHKCKDWTVLYNAAEMNQKRW